MTPAPTQEQFDLLTQVIRTVARSRRLSADAAADFSQSVHLKLLERNYDIFHRFSGRSTLRTFLTVVVRRQLLDWRNHCDGKWRPTVTARRLGADAITLERLTSRDGYTRSEAVEMLRSQQPALDAGSLNAIIDRLPVRHRRRMIPADALPEMPDHRPFDVLDHARTAAHDGRRRAAVLRALRQLPDEDRRLIRMRFGQGQSVQAVAKSMQVNAKTLYRRYDRVLRSLREAVVSAEGTASSN